MLITPLKAAHRSSFLLALLALACSTSKPTFAPDDQQTAAGEPGNEGGNTGSPDTGGTSGSGTSGSSMSGSGGSSGTGATSTDGGVPNGEGGVPSGVGGEPGNTASCEVAARRCSASGVPQLCNAEGAWQNEAACQFACVDGFCGGECKPKAGRCDAQTGVPQLCSSTGEWDNQAACGAQRACSAGECLCTAGLTTCGNSCVTLTNNADHCGSCGHSCLGGTCSNSKCQPVELAAGLTQPRSVAVGASHVYWMDYNDGVGNVKRVPKAGGKTEVLATNQGTPGGVVLANGELFWGAGTSNSKGAVTSPAIQRSALDGTNRVAFAPITNTVDYVALSGSKIYWNERNPAVIFYSKAITSTGNPVPAGTHANNSNMFAVAGDCVYFRTFVNSVYGLQQSCGGATPTVRFSSTTNIIISNHDAADSTMLYFATEDQGILRLPLTGSAQATNVTTGIDSRGPVVDGSSLYYIDGDTGGAPACTTNWGIYQVAKQPGSQRVTLLAPPLDCPGSIASDANAIYWAYYTTGTIMMMAK